LLGGSIPNQLFSKCNVITILFGRRSLQEIDFRQELCGDFSVTTNIEVRSEEFLVT